MLCVIKFHQDGAKQGGFPRLGEAFSGDEGRRTTSQDEGPSAAGAVGAKQAEARRAVGTKVN